MLKLNSGGTQSLCTLLPTRLHPCSVSPYSSAMSDGVGKLKKGVGKVTYTNTK